MMVEIPRTGGRIEVELIPVADLSLPLSVKLGKSGHVVYALPAMLKMGFRIVECTPANWQSWSRTGSPSQTARLRLCGGAPASAPSFGAVLHP
jgi:hypothetical protein